MGADGERVSHLVKMIHMTTDLCHFEIMAESGFANRLEAEANQGGFLSHRTMEASMLVNSIQYLRATATRLEGLTDKLVANEVSRVQ